MDRTVIGGTLEVEVHNALLVPAQFSAMMRLKLKDPIENIMISSPVGVDFVTLGPACAIVTVAFSSQHQRSTLTSHIRNVIKANHLKGKIDGEV